MAKCVLCKINVAVVFTTRFENGQRINEGLCLKCAYKTGLGGMDELFAKAGINDGNIDELTERLNGVMSQVEGKGPEDMFRALLSGSDLENLTESLGFISGGEETGLMETDQDQEEGTGCPQR